MLTAWAPMSSIPLLATKRIATQILLDSIFRPFAAELHHSLQLPGLSLAKTALDHVDDSGSFRDRAGNAVSNYMLLQDVIAEGFAERWCDALAIERGSARVPKVALVIVGTGVGASGSLPPNHILIQAGESIGGEAFVNTLCPASPDTRDDEETRTTEFYKRLGTTVHNEALHLVSKLIENARCAAIAAGLFNKLSLHRRTTLLRVEKTCFSSQWSSLCCGRRVWLRKICLYAVKEHHRAPTVSLFHSCCSEYHRMV